MADTACVKAEGLPAAGYPQIRDLCRDPMRGPCVCGSVVLLPPCGGSGAVGVVGDEGGVG